MTLEQKRLILIKKLYGLEYWLKKNNETLLIEECINLRKSLQPDSELLYQSNLNNKEKALEEYLGQIKLKANQCFENAFQISISEKKLIETFSAIMPEIIKNPIYTLENISSQDNIDLETFIAFAEQMPDEMRKVAAKLLFDASQTAEDQQQRILITLAKNQTLTEFGREDNTIFMYFLKKIIENHTNEIDSLKQLILDALRPLFNLIAQKKIYHVKKISTTELSCSNWEYKKNIQQAFQFFFDHLMQNKQLFPKYMELILKSLLAGMQENESNKQEIASTITAFMMIRFINPTIMSLASFAPFNNDQNSLLLTGYLTNLSKSIKLISCFKADDKKTESHLSKSLLNIIEKINYQNKISQFFILFSEGKEVLNENKSENTMSPNKISKLTIFFRRNLRTKNSSTQNFNHYQKIKRIHSDENVPQEEINFLYGSKDKRSQTVVDPSPQLLSELGDENSRSLGHYSFGNTTNKQE